MAENRELALVLRLVADQFKSELAKSQGALGSFNNFIKDWKTQLTAAGTALFAIAKSAANYGDELFKTSQKVGINVEALAGLQHAARLADVDNRQLQVGLQALSRAMVDAAQRSGEGYDAFRRVGVSATDANGQLRPMEDVFLDLADVFANSADGAGKTEVAMKLLGQSGVDLIPLMNGGKVSIREFMAEARRLGLVLSKEEAQAAKQFNYELTRLQAAAKGLSLQLGKELIPAFTELVKVATNAGSSLGGKVIKGEFQGLAAIFTLLNHGIRETSAELDVFWKKWDASPQMKQFWNDALVEGRKKLDSETSKRLHTIFSGELGAPGGGDKKTPPGGADKPSIGTGPDQKKLAEDYKLYLAGLLSMGEDYRNKVKGTGDEMVADYKEQLAKQQAGYALYIQGLTSAGEQYQAGIKGTGEQLAKEFQEHQRDVGKERDELVKNLQAWVAYDEQVGASNELRRKHQTELVKAQLSKEYDLTIEQLDQLRLAYFLHDDEKATAILDRTALTNRQREQLELELLGRLAAVNEQTSDDIFAGWAKGLERYVRDTKSGFGMAADMARRAAQLMESSFQRFFFDVWDRKVTNMRDVLESLGEFSKQITGTVFAQLATRAVLGGFGIGANSGGMLVQRFAAGGPVLGTGNLDTVPALLTPGEFVLNRQDVSDIKRGLVGGNVQVVNHNYTNAQIETSTSRGSDGTLVITQVIRETVRGLVRGGELDSSLRQRYGLSPSPGRR